MAITRGTTTGKLSTVAASSVAGNMGSTPATGSLIVVQCWAFAAFSWQAGDVTDNQGNTYHLACGITRVPTNSGAAIFYAENVTSSGTFTLTLNPQNTGSTEMVMVATEWYGDVTGQTRLLDRAFTQYETDASPTVGPTDAIYGQDDAVVAACFAILSGEASITVESVSPSWTEDAEELDFGLHIPGEAVSRVVTGGGTQDCTWSVASSAGWVAAMAVFTVLDVEPPEPGGGEPEGGEPDEDSIPTGITRIFALLTYGEGSPYSQIKLTETPFFFDPPSWYGGYGFPWLLEVGTITRELSDSVKGTEVVVRFGDPDYFFRTLATTESIAGATLELFLVSDTVRYALGVPHRRFAGVVHDHKALPNLQYELVARDVVSEELGRLADAPVIPPGRLTQTIFPGMTADYENKAIPIALGEVSDESEITPQGVVPPLIVAPSMNLTTFGGSNIEVVGAILSHGALGPNGLFQGYYNPVDNPYSRIPIPASAEGTILTWPGAAGWNFVGVATDYIDFPSTPSLTHRYTPVFFLASDPNVQAFIDGRIQVAFNVFGVTDEPDGSGLYYADAPDIYAFLLRNYLYPPHWRYGAYNAMPSFHGGYSFLNRTSMVRSRSRLNSYFGSPNGYPVGFLLGRGGQQQTLKHVLTELCHGVLMEQGIDRHGRILLDVEDVDAEATLSLSDLLDIPDGFTVWVDRASYRNNAEEVHGYRYLPAVAPLPAPPEGEALPAVNVGEHNDWSAVVTYLHDDAIAANRGKSTPPLKIENYVVRNSDVALNRVQREIARLVGPSPSYDGQRLFSLTTSWQALELELGDVIAIDHFEGMGAAGYVGQRARVLKITDNLQAATITLEGRVLFSEGSPS